MNNSINRKIYQIYYIARASIQRWNTKYEHEYALKYLHVCTCVKKGRG